MRADPQLAERVAFTNEHGLPLSQFLAWPDSDQDLALAHRRLMQDTCSVCGTRQDEWRGPDGRLLFPEPWEPAVMHCAGCARLAAYGDEVRNIPGGRVILRRHADDDNEQRRG